MAKCSNCGKEVSALERDIFTGACRECQKIGARPASLGCGSIILIAIVVAMFLQSSFQSVERRQRDLQRTVDSLQVGIAQQTVELRALHRAIDSLQKSFPPKTR